jgi:hypothetical protein
MRNAISYFPARPLVPDERALVAEWLASVGDIAATYVSSRRGDDPAHYRRIVIVTKPDEGPSHLVHAPSGSDIWIVFSVGKRTRIRRFPTLRAALNSIRPVLADCVPIRAPASSGEPPAIFTNTSKKRLLAERTTEQDDDPEATVRLKAFFACMIRPGGPLPPPKR